MLAISVSIITFADEISKVTTIPSTVAPHGPMIGGASTSGLAAQQPRDDCPEELAGRALAVVEGGGHERKEQAAGAGGGPRAGAGPPPAPPPPLWLRSPNGPTPA
jgi:hypothetical protein